MADNDPDELSNVSGFVLPRKEIIAIAAAAAAAAVEAVLNGPAAVPVEVPSSRRLSIPEWATYDGFRAHMQGLQEEWGPKKKTVMAGLAGVSLRALERRMRHFNLPASLWPPSKWPARQPRRLRPVPHGPATLAAGLPLMWGLIDVFFDGRLDGFVRASCALVGHTIRL